ncbi:MAG TPA: proline iminopeptidase-family hydrolase [Terriglobales bacterium]|nr:proline iminopeptidase-family hydrolase [Terriglobales bacterium]
MSSNETSGFVNVNGYQLFYRTFGTGDNILLCLHGGPGATHQYLLSLGKLGDDKVKVVLFDQLGVGRSEKPKDLSLLTIEQGAEDVEGFRKAMNLGKVYLFGSSYGGALALQYALKYQQNIKKMIIAGGLASFPETIAEMNRLKAFLPKDVQDTMAKYEERWAFTHPEYLKAVDVFYRNFLCRLPKWPEEVTNAMNDMSTPVYWVMNGPNEFTIIGNLKDWDITARLPEIKVPTLVTVGRYDEVTPKVAETIHKGIKGSSLRVFENSAHMSMWDEEEAYLKAVRDFISQ